MVLAKKLFVSATLLAFVAPAFADVYMHAPRGSNNRNCRNDNNTNRRNGNRLFDSQNNDKGGYSCPRAYPFACYDNACGNGATAQIQNNGVGAITGQSGDVPATNTPQQYYYDGSVLPIEWTNQHGCGTNTKVRCKMVIQYGCEDTMALMRDGTPTKNNSGNNLLDEATDTIPDNTNNNAQNDYRYGRHETLASYQACEARERNKGLYTADQDINNDDNDATFTRQNPNGNRNGLECPEESEYYPYWGDSPWKDMAVLADNTADCAEVKVASQNVAAKGSCTGANTNTGKQPGIPTACTQAGGTWTAIASYNLDAPSCALGPWTRDNHLGNAGAGNVPGQAATFNITVPKEMVGKNSCVVRLRYNMSTSDTVNLARQTLGTADIYGFDKQSADEVTQYGDVTKNNAIADRNENEVLSYKKVLGFEVGTAVNTNQFGRVFQDRSYTFAVKAAPTTGNCAGKAIMNLNVRGKRGNIVQAYPSVEYDFSPSVLEMEADDCVHVQFAGSDYNPNRNPNNGEGGPSNPNNDNEAKSDRSNMLAMELERTSFPVIDTASPELTTKKMFTEDTGVFQKLAFLDQNIGGAECDTILQLKAKIGGNGAANREQRERYHTNCAKLSGQKTPIFDAGLLTAGTQGNHAYMSTRNNNLSNRGHKGLIKVMAAGALDTEPGQLPSNANNDFGAAGSGGVGNLTTAETGFVFAGVVAGGLVAVGAAFVAYRKMQNNSAGSAAPMTPMAGGGAGTVVTARYAHNAKEAGELSFQKGEQITVLRQDASGWWEGQSAAGARGVFPSNYVQ